MVNNIPPINRTVPIRVAERSPRHRRSVATESAVSQVEPESDRRARRDRRQKRAQSRVMDRRCGSERRRSTLSVTV